MTHIPTVEQFLADQSNVDETEFEHADPLQSIADSLRQLVGSVVEHDTEESPDQRLKQAFDDLEAKHQTLWLLLAEVEKIVKPSTSKVSLEVKAAIEAWKSPEISEQAEPVAEPVPASNATEMGYSHPAHDADVEEWRTYARVLGYQGKDVDQANRSQIRTMLGIEQPAS
jgi:hypothetical protein